ncbi:MAG TPA: trypsin-like serine protease [Nocardioidaceae bacterium]|nr:trypsin-like serine protease [Nocardioidaceae bacterium]
MAKRVLLTLFAVAVAAAMFLTPSPASAITHGQPDGGEHPYVGELIFFDADAEDSRFDDPGSWFSCSATMLSATVIVTAGHCAFGVGEDGESTTTGGGDGSGGNDIWFDASENAHFDGFPASADYDRDENHQRYLDRAAFLNASPFWHRGTSFPHPEFDPAEFFVHDAGVVVLDEPFPMDTYGTIPTLDYLDQYQGQPRHLFEVVGYGLTKSGPFTAEGGDVRLKGDVKLNSLGGSPPDTFVLLSNNPGKPHPGGTCFGDSGGPTFDDTNSTLVVAVTSFASSSTCSGIGGAYRLDQPDDLAFLASFGITP